MTELTIRPAALHFPHRVFESQNKMDDYQAPDMRYGDHSEYTLKTIFGLTDVSARVNPYTRAEIAAPGWTYPYELGRRPNTRYLSTEECLSRLFAEFHDLAWPFTMIGPYAPLIHQMIDHMRYGNGATFRSPLLDQALREQLVEDLSKDSTVLNIKESLRKNIDWKNKLFPAAAESEIKDAIIESILPKFNRPIDSVNGMGITVHDIWSAHITLKSLYIGDNDFRAVIHYRVQDHFGLNDEDILKWLFRQFIFFRIWFVLQHYGPLAQRPFITEMETEVEITGTRG
ncbi:MULTISPECIES: YPO3983 family protein [unclassified Brenneria]|uniref:YPO3983 family protein n=1 Tax=unclassified Brenneria TaxID=2634434 RepID=UPI0029C1F26A|nr:MULTISPECIES: YPO3983 family protein [unclassified Brenneria]MDX5628285.1 YPO3983 family protein [Brenneria sp. L3-3Z]MDX5695532.1 YPO3983 family protein [Brenneria sp. L4-2C]